MICALSFFAKIMLPSFKGNVLFFFPSLFQLKGYQKIHLKVWSMPECSSNKKKNKEKQQHHQCLKALNML